MLCGLTAPARLPSSDDLSGHVSSDDLFGPCTKHSHPSSSGNSCQAYVAYISCDGFVSAMSHKQGAADCDGPTSRVIVLPSPPSYCGGGGCCCCCCRSRVAAIYFRAGDGRAMCASETFTTQAIPGRRPTGASLVGIYCSSCVLRSKSTAYWQIYKCREGVGPCITLRQDNNS